MPLGARQDAVFYTVCLTPDVCLTPSGPATPPVPYMITRDLSPSSKTIKSVKFNGKPAFVIDHSMAGPVIGDQMGTAKGVQSGCNMGKVWAKAASSNVRAEGRQIVRVGDEVWMNAQG
jgi:Domain of unknown function (DUF4150)